MKSLLLALFIIPLTAYTQKSSGDAPLRVGIAGLTHGHVHWILRAAKQGEVKLTGIAEKNTDLARRLMKQYDIDPSLLYADLDEMLRRSNPEAVTAFGSVYDHLAVVKACAPHKVHVMVEKPLAVSLDHARQMEALAREHRIHLLTNYETTWYGTNHKAFQMIHRESLIGDIVKMVFHHGHQGPREIGVNNEFFEWLTDPVLNGGGALMDFGCYGADLATWLMKGERPLSVLAVTQQIKPHIYPRVDDEATIIVTYPKSQAIIQASWNWPYNRKDMEVYGQTGYILADKEHIRHFTGPSGPEVEEKIPVRRAPYNDPFLYLAAVIRGTIPFDDKSLSSLEVNMVAMEILDAAKRSAQSGSAVILQERK